MKKTLFGAALAAMTIAGTASASTVDVAYQAGGLYGSSNLSQDVTISTPNLSPEVDGEFRVGMYHMTANDGLGDFMAFCVDLAQYLHNPTKYTYKPDLFTGTTLTNINKLFSSALGGAEMGSAIDTAVKAAGLQVALWEVVYDSAGTLNLGDGEFQATGNVLVEAQAAIYLSGVAGAADDAYNLTFLYSDTKQDIVTVSPVPLPASGLLFGFALAGLGALRRRCKKA